MGKLVLFGGISTRAVIDRIVELSATMDMYVYTVIFFTGDIDGQSEKPIGKNRQDHLYQTYISQSRYTETNMNRCDV